MPIIRPGVVRRAHANPNWTTFTPQPLRMDSHYLPHADYQLGEEAFSELHVQQKCIAFFHGT